MKKIFNRGLISMAVGMVAFFLPLVHVHSSGSNSSAENFAQLNAHVIKTNERFQVRVDKSSDEEKYYDLGLFTGGETLITPDNSQFLLSKLGKVYYYDFYTDEKYHKCYFDSVEIQDQLDKTIRYRLLITLTQLTADKEKSLKGKLKWGCRYNPFKYMKKSPVSIITGIHFEINSVTIPIPQAAFDDICDLHVPDGSGWVEKKGSAVLIHLMGGHAWVNGEIDNGAFRGYLEINDGKYSGRKMDLFNE